MNKKRNIETMYPLSPAQLGMFYETVQTPGSGVHIEQFACTLHGSLQREVFVQAWQQVVQHYAILRTAFVWSEQNDPVQGVMRQVQIPLLYEDWRNLPPVEQAQKLEHFLQQDRVRGFKLSHPPLMRLTLFQTSETSYEFVWTHHHILMDGWCCSLVQNEFLHCYEALCNGRGYQPESSRPYRDYIAWLKQQDEVRAEDFWRQSLQGIYTPTSLGRSATQPEVPRDHGFGTLDTSLPMTVSAQLQQVTRERRLTLNTLLQGVWALQLARYSGQQDVLFGITVSGRPPELVGAETMVGLCINTLPLRVCIDEQQSLWNWLPQLQDYNLELRQFEYVSGGKVHQWSQIHSGQPLYESLLVVENYPVGPSVLQAGPHLLRMSNIRSIGAQTKYPLTLLVIPGEQLGIRCVYNRQRLDEGCIQNILEHFSRLLTVIATSSDCEVGNLQHLISDDQFPVMYSVPIEHAQPEDVNGEGTACTPLEEQLLHIWQEVLGRTQLSVHDNFFQSGGHSLLATQVISRIRQAVQVEVPLRTLFEAPTISALAKRIGQLQQQADQTVPQKPALRSVPRTGPLPVSFAQHRLWFLQRLSPESSSYNSPLCLRIRGNLQITALQDCINEIVRRHESLRTSYCEINDQPMQMVHPPEPVPLSYIDLRSRPLHLREQLAIEFATQEGERLFNLARSPLIRTVLLQLRDEDYVLLITVHHIAFDAWSVGIFQREFITLYKAFTQGKPSPLPELPAQYADFAHWQRNWLQGKEMERLITYWQRQLRGAPELELPTDRPRPVVSTFKGASCSFTYSQTLTKQLQQLSQQEGVTLFMTLLTAFNILLYRQTNQEDIVLGTDIANRTLSETELMIGFFVNLLVLRTNLGGKPGFRETLTRVREMVLGAYAHQDLPFEKLVEALHLERSLNRTPLVRCLFVMQNVPLYYTEAAGLTLSPFQGDLLTAKFDFVIFLFESEQGIQGSVNYSTELFNEETIQRMMQRFEALLHSIVAQPHAQIDALDFHTEQEKASQQVETQEQHHTLRRRLKAARREEIVLP